ncbi:hypothetical protein PIB30_099408, partial [Stylosanthes scabra]|nr:hypothetical protein [Stylosanthes scabra]
MAYSEKSMLLPHQNSKSNIIACFLLQNFIQLIMDMDLEENSSILDAFAPAGDDATEKKIQVVENTVE